MLDSIPNEVEYIYGETGVLTETFMSENLLSQVKE